MSAACWLCYCCYPSMSAEDVEWNSVKGYYQLLNWSSNTGFSRKRRSSQWDCLERRREREEQTKKRTVCFGFFFVSILVDQADVWGKKIRKENCLKLKSEKGKHADTETFEMSPQTQSCFSPSRCADVSCCSWLWADATLSLWVWVHFCVFAVTAGTCVFSVYIFFQGFAERQSNSNNLKTKHLSLFIFQTSVMWTCTFTSTVFVLV